MSGKGRAVALSNGLIATALVAVLAAVALVVKPPAPPGIAEFAPQATKPITKAPPGQAALHGSGSGTCAVGQTCAAAPKPTAVATAVPTLSPGTGAPPGLQCYQWPDGTVTQTEDPQSPPCIATWDAPKGNGGATARGVTGTTITVLVPWLHSAYQNKYDPLFDARIMDLQTYFNRRFQLYGRSLRFVAPVSTFRGCDPSTIRAASTEAGQQRVFASTEMAGCEGNAAYPTALAERHILAVSHTSAELTRRSQVRGSPYLWSYAPAFDTLQQQIAEFACKNLRGKADYAGPATQAQARSFAFLRRPDDTADLSLLRERLSGCLGATPPVKEYDPGKCEDGSTLQQQMLALSQAGITTLIAEGGSDQCPQKAADAVGYQPEWFLVPTSFDFFQESARSASAGHPASQMGHTFGVMPLDKLLASQQELAFRAITSISPSHAPQNIVYSRSMYEQLLLLVSGIQMAGPHLTPATFAAGLESTDFSNPVATPRGYQGHVGFSTDDHAMLDDAGVWWWSTTVKTVDGGPGGGFCYVDRGERWALGRWPSNLRLQQQASCR